MPFINRLIRRSSFPGIMLVTGFVILFSAFITTAGAGQLDVDVQVQTAYDDNVLDYSDADLDLISDPLSPANKYGIKSKDDYIITPMVDITYKTFFAGHSFHLGIVNSYAYFKKNDVKRYYRFESYFRRYFSDGFYFQGRLGYLPDYYYRNSFSLLESYQEAKFDKLFLEAKLAYQISPKLQSNLYYAFANKDFIPIFDDRDIKEHAFKGELVYRPTVLWKGWASYAFTHGIGAGEDIQVYPRDTSFDMNSFLIGSRFYLRGINSNSWQLAAYVSFSQVVFQTSKITAEDRYRLGREDRRWYISLMTDHRITRNFNLGFEYRRMVKNVDLPATDLQQYLEAKSNSYYFVLNCHL